jgi:hypothetical protein
MKVAGSSEMLVTIHSITQSQMPENHDYLINDVTTGELIRFRGFRLTQLCFNSCLLFYSNYPLHVSVV